MRPVLLALVAASGALAESREPHDLGFLSFPPASTETWFVMFYAPWCGHCRQVEPMWAELATLTTEPDHFVGKVDATNHPITSMRYEVRGYPTLLLFTKGSIYPYNGPRSAASFLDFMNGGYAKTSPQASQSLARMFMAAVTDDFARIHEQISRTLEGCEGEAQRRGETSWLQVAGNCFNRLLNGQPLIVAVVLLCAGVAILLVIVLVSLLFFCLSSPRKPAQAPPLAADGGAAATAPEARPKQE